jgi:O-antigen/teichoic acid export membrane protein
VQVLKEKFFGITKSNLFRSGGIYTISSVIEKAIPFLLLPVLTRYLSTEDYGIVSMFTVLVGIAMPFVGYNGHSAILRNYFKDDIDIPVYIGNTLFILLGSSVLAGLAIFLFSDFISSYSNFPEKWLGVIVLVAMGQFTVNIILVNWQAQNKAIQYGIFKILLTLLNFGLAIFLIVGLDYGWEGRVIGKVSAVVLFGISAVSILWYNNLIKFQIVYEYLKHALSYGIPLIPHVLSAFVITMIDRVFITNMVGVSATGIYTVGYQIGMIIGILATSFNKAWVPWLFEKLNQGKEETKKKIVQFTYGYFVVVIGLALILSLLAPWFMTFFVGKSFSGSTIYVSWIALGYAFNGMYFMVGNYIFYEEKTHLLSWMTFIAATVNTILNYFLIIQYGAMGAAIATTITFAVQFLLTWYLAAKVHKMPWFSFYK